MCEGSVTESQDVLISTNHNFLKEEAGMKGLTENVTVLKKGI